MFVDLPPRPKRTRLVHVVIDTPKGSRNKYKFDPALGCFRLSRILPIGAVFPWNFGFIPGTRAEDGDAIDVLVVMDESVPIGTLLEIKLIGVFKATQTENRKTIRNDRLVGVPSTKVNPPAAHSLSQLGAGLLDEVEHFFESYNRAQGRTFTPGGRLGAAAAEQLVRRALPRTRSATK